MMVENYYKGQNILNNSPYNGEQESPARQLAAKLASACDQHTWAMTGRELEAPGCM
jgi:hypothetical protein